MLHYRVINGVKHIVFTRDGDNEAVFFQRKQIDNVMSLTVGTAGSGKSVMNNHRCFKLMNQGMTVIFASEKPGAEFDNAYCLFPQDDPTMLEELERWGIAPLPAKDCRALGKLYHPVTTDIPKQEKLPPINFFSFDLRALHTDSLSALFDGDQTLNSFIAVKDTIPQLQRHEGILTLIDKITLEMKKDEKKERTRLNDFGQEESMEGTITTAKHVQSSFRPFLHHCFLQPSSSPFLLDFVSLLNDNKHMHFFSCKWIKDAKVRAIFTIMLLKEIHAALSTGKVKRKICLVLEEAQVNFSGDDAAGFARVLELLVMRLLNTLRSYAMVILTAQSYFGVAKPISKACNEKVIGKLNDDDRNQMLKLGIISQNAYRLLGLLHTGMFTRFQDIVEEKLHNMVGFKASPPPFAIQPEGENFFQRFRKVYPEELQSYRPLVETLHALRKEEHAAQLARVQERAQRKKAAQKAKIEQEIAKKVTVDKKDKEALKKEVYQYYRTQQLEGKKISWRKLGEKFDVSEHTAKKYVMEFGG